MIAANLIRSRWFLPASLFLNVFLLGAVVAGLISLQLIRPPFPPPPPGPRGMFEQMISTLPPNDADVLRRSFAERQTELDAAAERMEQELMRARDLLRAEPFDEISFRETLMNARTAREQMDKAIIETALQALPNMTAQGRAQLSQMPPPGPPRGRPPHEGPQRP